MKFVFMKPQENESSQVLRQIQDSNAQVFAVPPMPANIQEKARLAPSVSSQTGLTSKKLVSLQKQLKTLKRKCVRKEAEGEEPQQQTGIQEGAQAVSVYVTKWMSRGRTGKALNYLR